MVRKSNPYSEMISIMKPTGQPIDYRIGRVISASPLTIDIGGLQIDRANNLLVDDLLVNDLRSGDQVFVIQSSDQQSYIVLSRLKGV